MSVPGSVRLRPSDERRGIGRQLGSARHRHEADTAAVSPGRARGRRHGASSSSVRRGEHASTNAQIDGLTCGVLIEEGADQMEVNTPGSLLCRSVEPVRRSTPYARWLERYRPWAVMVLRSAAPRPRCQPYRALAALPAASRSFLIGRAVAASMELGAQTAGRSPRDDRRPRPSVELHHGRCPFGGSRFSRARRR